MRKTGILMHISSLPSLHGIGSFGHEAYAFADFLKSAKQSFWQILPLGPTGYGDSPYQSFSTFAGNPYFIDLALLCEEGLLESAEVDAVCWGRDPRRVDFGLLFERRFDILKRAFSRFVPDAGYGFFLREQAFWLDDYTLFMSLKFGHDGRSWHEWEREYRLREPEALEQYAVDHAGDLDFWRFVQYKFFTQWRALKDYVNGLGIKIIGDIPIYVADDSADVWSNRSLFELDDEGVPRRVAGCPPDAFSDSGQLWGNPIYDWARHRQTGYEWWLRRIRAASELFDVVRIDHFRGFESFYAIPGGAVDARIGVWEKACGIELFDAVKKQIGDLPIIAENLGLLTDEVRELHKQTGYPGMNLLEFAFGADDFENEHLPHNLIRNTVVYAGTHDNEPIRAWFAGQNERDRRYMLDYMGQSRETGFCDKFIRLIHSTVAYLSIIQMQDYLGLKNEARMNHPSTLSGNWQWRARREVFTDRLAQRIARLTELYGRS